MNIGDDDGKPRLEIELGEVDDIQFAFRRRASAWTTYLRVAAEVEPEVIGSLLTAEALTLLGQFRKEGPLSSAYRQMQKHISAWCEHWGFLEQFARIPAQNTLAFASRPDTPVPTTFTSDVHGHDLTGEEGNFVTLTTRQTIRSDGTTDEAAELGVQLPDILPAFYWDATRETKFGALERIMGEIEEIIRTDLDTIEAAYFAEGFKLVRKKRQPDHYVWLARRLIRKESVSEIAGDLRPDRRSQDRERTIRRGIQSAAQELDIPLPRDRSGPKPKQRSVPGNR